MNFDGHLTRLERELRSAIEARRDEIATQLVSGNAVADFADYRRLTGYVAAFSETLSIMDEVRARLMKVED